MTNYVILSLEKLGDGIDAIPGTSKSPTLHDIRDPANVVSGVARGTKSLLGKVFGAVAGMIVEPLKGAKQGGLKVVLLVSAKVCSALCASLSKAQLIWLPRPLEAFQILQKRCTWASTG
jgi:hypothetical protein